MAAHGIARATDDIDILLARAHLERADAALGAEGWAAPSSSIPLSGGLELHRRLLFEGSLHHVLDLLVPPPSDEHWLDQRERSELAGAIAYVLAPHDLIAMKLAAGRPQDVADIARLRELTDGPA